MFSLILVLVINTKGDLVAVPAQVSATTVSGFKSEALCDAAGRKAVSVAIFVDTRYTCVRTQ
jgi:hypothetical protein